MTEATQRQSRIRPGHESELVTFLSADESSFERSTMGARLERAWLFDADSAAEQRAEERQTYGRLRKASDPWDPCEPTADITAETRHHGGYEPDARKLMQYAKTSRRLMLVEQRNALHAIVLRLYYGDLGARWGQMFVLYHLTEAGAALLAEADRRAREKREPLLDLTPFEKMAAQIEIDRKRMDDWRREKLTRADRQANELYRAACAMWCDVVRGS